MEEAKYGPPKCFPEDKYPLLWIPDQARIMDSLMHRFVFDGWAPFHGREY